MGLRNRKSQKNQRASISVAQNDGVQNAADVLLANIRFSEVDTPIKTICITSAVPNDGKTTVAVALAFAMARIKKSVVLLEGDMRRRSLAKTLSMHPRFGLHAVVSNHASLEEAVEKVPVGPNGLVFLLDVEQGIPNPEAILNSRVYREVLDRLAQSFDYVIIDTPPVAAFADASIVARQADGTVLVVRQASTQKAEAAYAAETLRAAGANLLGVAMNCEDLAASSAHYGYYYSYNYEKKEVDIESTEARAALGLPADLAPERADQKNPASGV